MIVGLFSLTSTVVFSFEFFCFNTSNMRGGHLVYYLSLNSNHFSCRSHTKCFKGLKQLKIKWLNSQNPINSPDSLDQTKWDIKWPMNKTQNLNRNHMVISLLLICNKFINLFCLENSLFLVVNYFLLHILLAYFILILNPFSLKSFFIIIICNNKINLC